LKSYDLSNFSIDKIPQTEYAIRNKKECLPAYYKMFIDNDTLLYNYRHYPSDKDHNTYEYHITAEDIYNEAQQYAKQNHLTTNFSKDIVAKKMKQIFSKYYNDNNVNYSKTTQETGKVKCYYAFPKDLDVEEQLLKVLNIK
jgi:hypothetical protein